MHEPNFAIAVEATSKIKQHQLDLVELVSKVSSLKDRTKIVVQQSSAAGQKTYRPQEERQDQKLAFKTVAMGGEMPEAAHPSTSPQPAALVWQRALPSFENQGGALSARRGRFFDDARTNAKSVRARLEELKTSMESIAERHQTSERRLAGATQDFQGALHRLDTLFIPLEIGKPVY